MGVITKISLEELQQIFPHYSFIKITPTLSGIIDTTYIVENTQQSFILKKYERDIKTKIKKDIELLNLLHNKGLYLFLSLF